MKKKLRGALFAGFSFYLLANFFPGFSFDSGQAVIISAALFAFFYLFVRPVLKILSLPLNLATFGLFSLLINVVILFLIAFLVGGFNIVDFRFEGLEILGIGIPPFYLNKFFSAAAGSVALSIVSSIFFWIFS